MSAVKRRVSHAASPDMATPEPFKRLRKRNDDTYFPNVETVDTTIELGRKIIGLLKRSQDKNGRLVASAFLDLPDRDEYPDYYQQVVMPMSIHGIEKQLEAGHYSNMTDLESDLKRVVQNAKDYNSTRSEIFEDAERIRKALSNFMPKHNPAYQDPEYRAQPTPVPEHLKQTARDSSASGSEPATSGVGIKLRLNTGKSTRQNQVASEIEEDGVEEELEEMQLSLLQELSAQENAINFEEKPSKREIPHYYKVIERPTSISDVRSLTQKGKTPTWTEFAKEVRLIWSNAKEYNEPGSEIYTMAEELETWFEEKLQAQGVPRKIMPRLSLKTQQAPKAIKLKLGTPTQSSDSWKVDGDALERQKVEMASALDRARRGSSKGVSTPSTALPSNLRRSQSVADQQDATAHVNGIAPETTKVTTLSGAVTVPTPAMEGEPPRLGTRPGLFPAASITNGYHTSDALNRPAPSPSIYAESNNPIERKFRDPGKGVDDALLESVTYMTHPQMPNDPKWKITRFASSTKTQTSHYIYLPHNHYYLRVIPNLSTQLKTRKRHKLCVAHNWTVQGASPNVAGGGAFDFRLQPGENVIVVDVIADLSEGDRKEYAPPQLQLDFERMTFYIILRDADAE